MDPKTAFEFAQFTQKHGDDYSMVVLMRKRKNAEGTSVMMTGEPQELMALFSQAVASFYKRYHDAFKEGVDVKQICSDIATGAELTLIQWDNDESSVTDMTQFQ